MPDNIGNIYNTKIPSFAENADVQTAFRLYHYGEDTAAPDTIQTESIAGHLKNLEDTKIDVSPVIVPVGANLNDYTSSGYFVDNNTDRSGSSNFPEVDSSSYPGFLMVINRGSVAITQQYHMLGLPDNQINTVFIRNYYAGSWSAWTQVANIEDILSQTNTVYYKIEGSSTETAYSKLDSDDRFAPKLFAEKPRPSTYTINLDDLSSIVQMNAGTLTIPADSTTNFKLGSIVNVYNSSPTSFLTIQGADGVTVRNPGTIEPYQEASLRKRAANEWVAAGPVY